MRKFLCIIGVMTAFIMSSCSKDKSCEECIQKCTRDKNVTVELTSPTLNQSLKLGGMHTTNWIGEETGETGYRVYLNWIQDGLLHSELLGNVKTTDCNFQWKVISSIHGKKIDSECCYLTFLGDQNQSYFAGEIFKIKP